MVNLWRLGLLMVFSFMVIEGNAQTFTPNRTKSFKTFKDTLVLDSLSLVPGTIEFNVYPKGDSSLIPEIDYKHHAIVFKGKKPDSIDVSYKRFPFNFEKNYYHKNADDLYSDMTRRSNPFTINYTNKKENLFQNDGLSKNGNISRGISFGNNQDIVVNSNLNLQVSGKLTPEIDLVMAATDNNIPFQADGTTAQLQEFDKVFIQLSNYNTKMIVGDYQLSRPQNSYFMNFYKRAQGLYIENLYLDSTAKKPLIFKTQVSGAVSRGKFSRQVFFGIENNQGPYRLKGAENEPFIIVLSGTEKIYIDGRLLQRGQENDYIIDYNTGELTFTAKQQITKDKRIVAEFQYAERNYGRSLFFLGEEVQSTKSKFYLNVYSEQDNKNRPLQQNLDDPDKKTVMMEAGDDPAKSVFTGASRIDTFSLANIQYRKIDTLVDGFIYSGVYVYSIDPENAEYILRMSFVGPGKGNYNQINNSANGKVYQWIAPVDNVPQGSYEPIVPLVTPKQSQMLTGGFTHSFTSNNTLGAEGVYTKYDVNKFSTKDKGNDEAGGVKILSKNQTILKTDSLKGETKLVYNVNYEFVQKQFTQIERFRSIEFERDWNRPVSSILLNDQNIASAELGLVNNKRAAFTYTFNFFNEGTNFEGLRHNVNGDFKIKNFSSNYNGAFLTTSDKLFEQNTQFYRHKTLVSQRVEKLRFTYSDVFENNLFKNILDNKIKPNAYQFWEWEGSVSNADSSKNNIKLFYRERRDKHAYRNTVNDLSLKDSTFATNIGLQASIFSIKNNPFTVLVTYRKLDLKSNLTSNSLKPDNTLLNRLEYNPRYFKGLIISSVFYETGYGQENKKDYYYLEVPPGQGQYAWNDYNNNGVQEKDEFELSTFADRQRFIRFYTPTNEYVKVLQNQFSISMSIRPSAILKDQKKAVNRFVNRWILQTTLRVDNKITDNDSINSYNPFATVPDRFLLAANNNSRYSVFFNQSSAIFGADYTHTDNKARQLLTNGIEERTLFSDEIKARFNFFKSWAINSNNTISKKGNRSEYFSIRDYKIKSYETEQKLIFQPNTVFRLSLIYKYTEKRNQVADGTQFAFLHTYAFEIKYNQTDKGSFTGRLDVIRINYNDAENSSVAYEMLNGLSKGDNFTWEIGYQRNLNSNIQISINYSGRKTPNTGAVHIGGAQIRAYF
ncbi:hypothetical protein [Aurantibacillus circumpalustris]|uniref:hypothetical protein n=1 Tax=Aurantibacillus circumpalustris TaxID=3036359 RepID=UPI00295BA1EE|nr:hypothetical protein [Aurantibacillus circumpalustris]